MSLFSPSVAISFIVSQGGPLGRISFDKLEVVNVAEGLSEVPGEGGSLRELSIVCLGFVYTHTSTCTHEPVHIQTHHLEQTGTANQW